MPVLIFALLAALIFGGPARGASENEYSPKLLLSAQRLRRLKRDRERQTPRWANFESRVKTEPDSPERGFELALYYAVTGDEARGKEAAVWATAHACEFRQVALVSDWVGSPIPAATKACHPNEASELGRLRDSVFLAIAAGDSPTISPAFLPAATRTSIETANSLYAAIEYIDAIRSAKRRDLREGAGTFFIDLPVRFLLSLPPEQLSKPDWRQHAAALALVSLDPNLEGSQFLQAWAMEDSQMVQNGPGVAYEFLWANPYLPGVSYRNMEPALYDADESRLVARTSWDDNACRIEILPGRAQSKGCPSDWQSKSIVFGRLTLVPMDERCLELPARPGNTTVILWRMKPQAKLTYTESGKPQTRNADDAGMWQVSAEYHGKVCVAK